MITSQLKTELLNLSSISELNEVIAFAREAVELKAKASISVGSKVFVVQKTKRTLGEVVKVNIKKAVVKLPNGTYNVPLSMLEAA
tara:strand:+ start:752 stop:1006 length:255 start_codon:yes stop_codon:yes gene_type:complete